jgi:hypothetical protein
MAKSNQQKRRAAQIAPSQLFFLFLLLLLKELIASPAPASSQYFFGLLHFEFALAFHFSVSGFTHERTPFSPSISIFSQVAKP